MVCFAQLKFNWGKEIRRFEKESHCGVTTHNFAKVFGAAYLKTFTPKLVLQAWEKTGVFPFNNKIIPVEKFAPSETSTIKYTSCVVHSTPVRKVMEAFLYFEPAPLNLVPPNTGDEREHPAQEKG